MTKPLSDELKFTRRYYKQLIGGKITAVRCYYDEENQWMGPWTELTIQMDGEDTLTEYKVEISQDPEGNGPGFLFGLPVPRDDRKRSGKQDIG
jgi:hypothetical protein